MQRRIGIFTPVAHIDDIYPLLKSKGTIVVDAPHADKNTVRDHLLEHKVNTIICNPNKQTYTIDGDLLAYSYVKTILTCSTGLSHIDLEYCQLLGVDVISLTDDMDVINNLPSTSELAFILMGMLLRKVPQSMKHVYTGQWNYEPFIGRQIKGLHIGIVGYGRLGKMMATFCKAFNASVTIYDPYLENETYWQDGVHHTTKIEELFTNCDVVSLHVHLNEETRGMINDTLLELPKKELYLVNTSRGGVVNEWAVYRALENGTLRGYATDVLDSENTEEPGKSPILESLRDGENVIVTPHIGGMTWEGQEFAYKSAINKL